MIIHDDMDCCSKLSLPDRAVLQKSVGSSDGRKSSLIVISFLVPHGIFSEQIRKDHQ